MADKKIPSLNSLTNPAEDDLLLIVDDVSNNPVNKKITLKSLFNNFELLLEVIGKSLIRRDLNVRRDANLRNEGSVEQPLLISSTVGLDDITSAGVYTGATSAQFDIEIDTEGTPDKFKWRKDGGSYTSTVSITGADQTLSDGVTIKFAATTGHTLGDKWMVTGLPVSRIDFGQGQILQEDTVPTAGDFSNEGFLTLESGIDIKLESGSTQDLFITANTSTIKVVGDTLLGETGDKLGFYGKAPVSQNTSSGSMSTVTHLKNELIRLGLIS